MKLTPKNIWAMLKQGFSEFGDINIMKMAAALAYYTVFALAPMLIIIISIIQFFKGDEAVNGELYPQIASFLGAEAGAQLQEMIKNATISGSGTISTIISVVVLLLSATGVFAEIQDSINSIWHLRAKPKGGMIKLLLSRLISFSMVVSIGFIMLVALMVNSVVESIMHRLERIFSDAMVYVAYGVNLLLTFVITTLLFAIIFKVLPDAVIKIKKVLPGAVATALLFMIGKFGITLYVSKSEIGSTYGAAGSIIVILVWVYYSAIILYFGALLTRIYLQCSGETIHPNKYAVFVREIQIENKAPLHAQSSAKEFQKKLDENEEDDKTKRVGF
jgi:membrane protein